nr:hypothetical protein Q903MT_gene1534 [Picea sitchensis]
MHFTHLFSADQRISLMIRLKRMGMENKAPLGTREYETI